MSTEQPKQLELRTCYSRAEIANKMTEWLIELYGVKPLELDQETLDQFYRDNGLLYHFITEHFPDL